MKAWPCVLATMALGAVGCAGLDAESARTGGLSDEDPAEEVFRDVPADALSVLFVDYAGLRAGDTAAAFFSAGEPPAEGRKRNGFSEAADVDRSVQVALPGDLGTHNVSSLWLHEGRIDAAAVANSDFARTGQSERIRDKPFWRREDRALVLLGRQRVAVGTESAVRAAIECSAGVLDPIAGVPWFHAAGRALAARWPRTAPIRAEARALITEGALAQLEDAPSELKRLQWIGIRTGLNASNRGPANDNGLRFVGVASTRDARDSRAIAAWFREKIMSFDDGALVAMLGIGKLADRIEIDLSDEKSGLVALGLDLSEQEWTHVRDRLAVFARAIKKEGEAFRQSKSGTTEK